jgi:hypothetical protein
LTRFFAGLLQQKLLKLIFARQELAGSRRNA